MTIGTIPRVVSAAIVGIALLACTAGSLMTLILSPAPGTGQISGVTLDLPNGYVVVTRHNLDCVRPEPESLSESCRFRLGEHELTVNVTHGELNQFSLSTCEAHYQDQNYACYGQVNTLGSAPYAVITYVDVPDDVMGSIARKHFLTSRRGEAEWTSLATNAAMLLAVSSGGVVVTWSTGRMIRRAGLTIAACLLVFTIAYTAFRIILFTTTFVD